MIIIKLKLSVYLFCIKGFLSIRRGNALNFIQDISTEHAQLKIYSCGASESSCCYVIIFFFALGHLSRKSIEASGWPIRYGGLFGWQQGRPNHCGGWHTETWEKA